MIQIKKAYQRLAGSWRDLASRDHWGGDEVYASGSRSYRDARGTHDHAE
jgi:hypothetical protein